MDTDDIPQLLPPTRSGRKRRAPRRHIDYLPSTTVGQLHQHVARLIPQLSKPLPETTLSSSPPLSLVPVTDDHVLQELPTAYDTEADDFGVFRRYTQKPRKNPEDEDPGDPLCDSPNITIASSESATITTPLRSFGQAVFCTITGNLAKARSWFAPFLNASTFRLMHWTYTGSNLKSAAETERLVHQVLLAPDFDREDLRGFSMHREEERLDKDTDSHRFSHDDGWHEATVTIRLPKEKTKHKSEQDAPKLRVNGVWYRKLLDVIVTAYQDPSAQHFNYIPYKLFCQKSTIFGGPESEDSEEPEDCAPPLEADLERIYTEVWTCDAMLEEDLKIRAQPRNPDDDDNVEYAIAPLMLWSDSTHLANFGTASLWPIYMYFASLTKYLRSKVSSFAAHHLAYLPSVSASIPSVPVVYEY
ncbi:hypothetical protein EW026_g4333 [Hermanssonia centrifuga]|uniref:Uncharacterized protein n=1 Tax=Hermanssonia centrifuga TaxID=98765 RepID=A0A4S4KHT3_9APHY|nr:hypothetical protein EW026_g4333 [Hermanssonia centrifuga]